MLLRWLARLASLGLLTLVALIAVAHGGFPNVLGQPVPVQVEFAALFLMLAGLLLGWFREASGGVLILLGVGLFALTEIIVNHRLPGGAIPWFLIPAVLFLTVSAMEMARLRDHRGTVR